MHIHLYLRAFIVYCYKLVISVQTSLLAGLSCFCQLLSHHNDQTPGKKKKRQVREGKMCFGSKFQRIHSRISGPVSKHIMARWVWQITNAHFIAIRKKKREWYHERTKYTPHSHISSNRLHLTMSYLLTAHSAVSSSVDEAIG